MDDREIIKLYNCRSEDALLETEKKYGKLVSFIIGKQIMNQIEQDIAVEQSKQKPDGRIELDEVVPVKDKQ